MEYGARRRRDLVTCLNWTGTLRKRRKSLPFKEKQLAANECDELFGIQVGVIGFEPTTLCSQSRCASQAALHPERERL